MRKGFTLIELIFVIVIIGILAAVAIPKYKDLKQHAEAANVIKIVSDSLASVPGAVVNRTDLEGDYDETNITLDTVLDLKGKDWSYASNKYTYKNGTNEVASIELTPSDRKVEGKIDCTKFSDSTTQEKCKTKLGQDSIDVTITY